VYGKFNYGIFLHNFAIFVDDIITGAIGVFFLFYLFFFRLFVSASFFVKLFGAIEQGSRRELWENRATNILSLWQVTSAGTMHTMNVLGAAREKEKSTHRQNVSTNKLLARKRERERERFIDY
jgi:hypothetical protein